MFGANSKNGYQLTLYHTNSLEVIITDARQAIKYQLKMSSQLGNRIVENVDPVKVKGGTKSTFQVKPS